MRVVAVAASLVVLVVRLLVVPVVQLRAVRLVVAVRLHLLRLLRPSLRWDCINRSSRSRGFALRGRVTSHGRQ